MPHVAGGTGSPFRQPPINASSAGSKRHRADFFWILFFVRAKKRNPPASAGTGIQNNRCDSDTLSPPHPNPLPQGEREHVVRQAHHERLFTILGFWIPAIPAGMTATYFMQAHFPIHGSTGSSRTDLLIHPKR